MVTCDGSIDDVDGFRAEPGAAPDRGRISVLLGSMALRQPRHVRKDDGQGVLSMDEMVRTNGTCRS